MKEFETKTFTIPKLIGISETTIEEHLKLYAGYVKHANLILSHIAELSKDGEKYTFEIAELQRRFGFEWGGMRNHEYYFSSLEKGSSQRNENSPLSQAIKEEFGSFEMWLARFKAIAVTRGVGWVFLSYDKKTKRLINAWVDEQHLGHLVDTSPVLALDMWEHSYVADYLPSGKKKYVDDFFENLNWSVIEKNFADAQ
ncbi:MAG: Fe-Mn family superoxide dismutase [Candidatus Paceibacterota bacterium]